MFVALFLTGQLALPVGLAADDDGNVLVTDSGTGMLFWSMRKKIHANTSLAHAKYSCVAPSLTMLMI